MNQKEIADLKQQLQAYEDSDKRIATEFGITLDDIVREYRELLKKQNAQIKPLKSINKYKEPDPCFLTTSSDSKASELLQKRSMGSFWTLGQKQPPRNSSKKESEYASTNKQKQKNT